MSIIQVSRDFHIENRLSGKVLVTGEHSMFIETKTIDESRNRFLSDSYFDSLLLTPLHPFMEILKSTRSDLVSPQVSPSHYCKQQSHIEWGAFAQKRKGYRRGIITSRVGWRMKGRMKQWQTRRYEKQIREMFAYSDLCKKQIFLFSKIAMNFES